MIFMVWTGRNRGVFLHCLSFRGVCYTAASDLFPFLFGYAAYSINIFKFSKKPICSIIYIDY